MVGYLKQHFFVRYRAFESWAHLNQLAEQWLSAEADQRLQGTVKEIVAERFVRELPFLHRLPSVRYDTAYRESRRVSWDGYVDVRGNRYSVHRFGRSRARLRRRLPGRPTPLARRDPGLGQRARPPCPLMAVDAEGRAARADGL